MKKGFTLVELLGVIIVLGLIALIVFPNITKSIRNSKNKLYQQQVDTIERNARRWGIEHTELLSEYSATYLPLSDLIAGGYLKKGEIIDPRTDNEMNGCIVIGYNQDVSQYEYQYQEQSCSEFIVSTPAECFEFDTATGMITGYNIDNEKCGEDVVIPDTIGGVTVTNIGLRALSQKQLKSVKIPGTVTNIGEYAFSHNGLTNIEIPSSVITIERYAFYSNQLTNVEIPSNVTTIGSSAFASNQLTSIDIPSTVTSMESGAFSNNKLKSVTIPEGITSIEESTFSSNELTSVTIPNSVTTIGIDAFSANHLTSIVIPENVTNIGIMAFMSNQLTSIVIPENVTNIGNLAFSSNELTSVTIKGKSSTSDFTTYGNNVWGWAEGYSDSNITWNG